MRPSKNGSPQFAPLIKAQQQVHPDSSPNADSGFGAPFFYEPTSVLDAHLGSAPAPAPAASEALLLDVSALPGLQSSWDDPTLSSSDDDWDPVTWLLGGGGGGEKDDSAPPPPKSFTQFPVDPALINHHSSLPPFPFYDPFDLLPSPAAVEFDGPFPEPTVPVLPPPPSHDSVFDQAHLDQLIRVAQAVESNDLPFANVILARLNHPLAAPTGRPIQRASCYFRDALQSLLSAVHDHRPMAELLLSPVEVVRKITAYKAFTDLSPVPQFASFTANQTVLEALDGARSIHLIDFEIGLGGQWSSFMHEVAERSRASRVAPPSVRITALVPEESLETSLTAENLRDFARGLGMRFAIEFVRVGGSGALALAAVRLAAGESVAVSFSPVAFRLLGGAPESVAGFLRFFRRASPRVAVFVDTESSCCRRSSTSAHSVPPPQSFRRGFTAGLEHYSVVLESLDAAAAAVGYGGDQVRRIERSLIRPRVFASVEASLSGRAVPWREMFEGAGMKPVPFSEFTEAQAEWLTRRAPIRGFHVARREGSMVLSWHGMELAATSAWRC